MNQYVQVPPNANEAPASFSSVPAASLPWDHEVPPGDVELTILMPCLNEALTLPKCIIKAQSYLARSGVIGEVLIADNGSTDGSRTLPARSARA